MRAQTAYSRIFFVFIATLSTLLLASCGDNESSTSVPVDAQAGDLAGLESCKYEANNVVYDADCGTLIVPENREDPNSRLIALPVIRILATGNDPTEPIFRLTGGPGNSNLGFSLLPWFIEDHDIVLVGYRGVDGPVVLACPEVTKAIKTISDDWLSDPALDSLNPPHFL